MKQIAYIKACLVLVLLFSTTLVHGQVNRATQYSRVFEIGPEQKWEVFEEKIKKFWADFGQYFKDRDLGKEILLLEDNDSVIMNAYINKVGLVDSVRQISPKYHRYESIKQYIEKYDFKGALFEFYTENEKEKYGRCNIQLAVSLRDRKNIWVSWKLLPHKYSY